MYVLDTVSTGRPFTSLKLFQTRVKIPKYIQFTIRDNRNNWNQSYLFMFHEKIRFPVND